jgi:LacI family gluconate utilization system Gnt-I transcriptional repressor
MEQNAMSQRGDGGKRRRKTLSDVAAHAGVSPVTVSRALRNPEMVSADLRQRVATAVQELAYIPNQLASALASSRTHRIGVIVPSLTNGVFGDYLRAIHDVFVPAGLQVLVLNSGYVAGMEETAIATMLGQHPEAMIVTGVDQTETARRMLREAAIPVVQTMEIPDAPIDVSIGLSQRDAGYAATRHLIDLGHRHIAQMSVPLDARARQRLSGYRDAIGEAGLEPITTSIERASSFPLGAELLAGLRRRRPEMTAVFCGNDNLALGAMFEAQRLGLKVPDDISIIGFNDLEFSATAFPGLTSVATPRYDIGRRSGEILLEIIRGSGERPKDNRIDLGFTLIERGSTARPRAG